MRYKCQKNQRVLSKTEIASVTAKVAVFLTVIQITNQSSLTENQSDSKSQFFARQSDFKTIDNKFTTSSYQNILAVQKEQSRRENMIEEFHRHRSVLSYTKNKENESLKPENLPPIFAGDRIVHLDLKGAPVSVTYYKGFLPLLRKLGATGLLMEYEDMYPYSGPLEDCASKDHVPYSKSDIREILKLAKDNGLEVIPLVQTFGHMEFILEQEKHAELRESPLFTTSICPSHNKTFALITEMIDQVMSMHPASRYLHIGCDEVLVLGLCETCKQRKKDNGWTNADLFLTLVTQTAKYVKERYPGVRPLIWDDHLRKHNASQLVSWQLADLVEPVVWAYTKDVELKVSPQVWEKYAAVFPAVWIASAFKGATGMEQFVTDIQYHLENHRSWMRVVSKYGDRLCFKGIMVTGWQRYFHADPLCELLPVAVPSLAVSLAYLRSHKNDSGFEALTSAPPSVVEALCCNKTFSLTLGSPIDCNFPGAAVLAAANKLYAVRKIIRKRLQNATLEGHFLAQGTVPCQAWGNTSKQIATWLSVISEVEHDMIIAMDGIYDDFTKDEWIDGSLGPPDQREETLLKYFGHPLLTYADLARIAFDEMQSRSLPESQPRSASRSTLSTSWMVFVCSLATVLNSYVNTVETDERTR